MSEIMTQNAADERIAAMLGSQDRMRPVLNAESVVEAANAAQDMAINATLRKDEWEIIDERVNEEARNRLTVFEAFRSRGLVQSVGVGDIIRYTEYLSAFSDAKITFDGDAEPEQDRPEYGSDSRAIPIVSHGFSIGFRQLASSSRRGNNLSTDSAGLAARAVAHKMQSLITNGLATGGPTGGGIPGLTTAPNAIDVSIGTNWDASGADIIGNVEAMLAAAYAGYFFGPFVLMVPKNYWATIQGDYSALKGDRTYLERILAFQDIEAVLPNDALSDDNVLLVQMTRDVMDISLALPMTTWQWAKTPARTDFRVLMIGGPQVKTVVGEDGVARNGIVHLS